MPGMVRIFVSGIRESHVYLNIFTILYNFRLIIGFTSRTLPLHKFRIFIHGFFQYLGIISVYFQRIPFSLYFPDRNVHEL